MFLISWNILTFVVSASYKKKKKKKKKGFLKFLHNGQFGITTKKLINTLKINNLNNHARFNKEDLPINEKKVKKDLEYCLYNLKVVKKVELVKTIPSLKQVYNWLWRFATVIYDFSNIFYNKIIKSK